MKIDSARVGMDSARSYASETKKSIYTLSAGIEQEITQGREQGSYTFSQLLWNAEEQENNETGTGAVPVDRIFRQQNTGKVAEGRQLSSLESFRQACIRFLIRWLYDGLEYRRMHHGGEMEYYHSESEDTSFHTEGVVQTSDGRQISFELELGMSRRFSEYTNIQSFQQLPQMTDPLVINLDTPVAALSDQKFEFDIDADGIKDSVSMLEAGSGFLALDQNGDGIINDGSELFGSRSGDGFADLAAYDKDGNGWIDENDSVFDKLLIWCKDPTGEDRLYSLKEAGVGAICLMKAQTDFGLHSLKDNRINGNIRQTGIFLYENGGVGTMQHLDLAR